MSVKLGLSHYGENTDRLMVFENRVLRGKFRSKFDELTSGWRKLQDEEFHNLHSSSNIVRTIKSKSVACMRHALILMAGKLEEEGLLGSNRCRQKYNIEYIF
jgi:hypothetical protein